MHKYADVVVTLRDTAICKVCLLGGTLFCFTKSL